MFNVTHIRGIQNVIAHTLSRIFESYSAGVQQNDREIFQCGGMLLDFALAFSDIKTQHNSDPITSTLIQDLHTNKDSAKFSLNKGVICHFGLPTRIYLPSSLHD